MSCAHIHTPPHAKRTIHTCQTKGIQLQFTWKTVVLRERETPANERRYCKKGEIHTESIEHLKAAETKNKQQQAGRQAAATSIQRRESEAFHFCTANESSWGQMPNARTQNKQLYNLSLPQVLINHLSFVFNFSIHPSCHKNRIRKSQSIYRSKYIINTSFRMQQ